MSDNSNSGCCGCSSIPWFLIGAIVSWILNHSIGWAILHGFLGAFYLVYALLFRTAELFK